MPRFCPHCKKEITWESDVALYYCYTCGRYSSPQQALKEGIPTMDSQRRQLLQQATKRSWIYAGYGTEREDEILELVQIGWLRLLTNSTTRASYEITSAGRTALEKDMQHHG